MNKFYRQLDHIDIMNFTIGDKLKHQEKSYFYNYVISLWRETCLLARALPFALKNQLVAKNFLS